MTSRLSSCLTKSACEQIAEVREEVLRLQAVCAKQIGAVKGKGKKGKDVKGEGKRRARASREGERRRHEAGREEQGQAVLLLPEESHFKSGCRIRQRDMKKAKGSGEPFLDKKPTRR